MSITLANMLECCNFVVFMVCPITVVILSIYMDGAFFNCIVKYCKGFKLKLTNVQNMHRSLQSVVRCMCHTVMSQTNNACIPLLLSFFRLPT